MPATTEDDLLSPREVHTDYGDGFTPQTLAKWRSAGIGPAYIKTSPGRTGRILYRRSAIEAWLDANTVTPESATA
jgi:hypothetical protein